MSPQLPTSSFLRKNFPKILFPQHPNNCILEFANQLPESLESLLPAIGERRTWATTAEVVGVGRLGGPHRNWQRPLTLQPGNRRSSLRRTSLRRSPPRRNPRNNNS